MILKFMLHFIRLSMIAVAIILYLLLFYECIAYGIKVWSLGVILFTTAILITSEYSYRRMIKSIVKIIIKAESTELIDANGTVYHHKTATVRKVKMCLMGSTYKILVEDQREVEYKCLGMVKVKKNSQKIHRGIWMEDFSGAEFIS